MRHPALVLILAALWAGPASAEAERPEECSEAAYNAGRRVAAACTQVIENTSNPADRALALFLRGLDAVRVRHLTQAAEDLRWAVALDPDTARYRREFGRALYLADRIEQGIAEAREAFRRNPSELNRKTVTWMLRDRGDVAGTIAHLDAAAEGQPENLQILLERQDVNYRFHRYADALSDIERLMKADPALIAELVVYPYENRKVTPSVYLHYLRISALLRLFRFDEALRDAEALVASETSAEALHLRAHVLVSLPIGPDQPMDHARVLADAEAAIALDPRFAAPYRLKADAEFETGKLAEALRSADRGLRLDPTDARLHWVHARILKASGKLEEASGSAETALGAARVHDFGFFVDKIAQLRERGYWQSAALPSEPGPALRDAVMACLLDDQCM